MAEQERQHAERLRDQAEQLDKLQRLQEGLMKQHAEQQETIASAMSASGGRACFNEDGKCQPTPACFSAEV